MQLRLHLPWCKSVTYSALSASSVHHTFSGQQHDVRAFQNRQLPVHFDEAILGWCSLLRQTSCLTWRIRRDIGARLSAYLFLPMQASWLKLFASAPIAEFL